MSDRMLSAFSRRRFLAGSAAAGLGALLVACGGAPAPAPTAAPAAAATAKPAEAKPAEATKPAEAPKPTAAAPKPTIAAAAPSGKKTVEVRYGTMWAGYRVEIIQPVLTEWGKTSGINVTCESVADRFTEKMLTQIAGGTVWDVWLVDSYLAPMMYDQKQVLDVGPNAQRDGIDVKKGYSLMGVELWDGKLYAMPYVMSPIAWYYNKNTLKTAGAPDPWDDLKGDVTWEDMLAIGLKVSDQKKKPATYGMTFAYNDIEQRLGGIVYSFGGKAHDYETMKYTLTDPKTVEAIKFVNDLVNKHKVLIPMAESAQLGQSGVANPFQGSICAMEMETTGRLTTNVDTIKDKFKWDVFPTPRKDKNSPPGVPYVSGNPNSAYAKSKVPDEAWETLKFMSGPVMMDVLSKKKLLMPGLTSAAMDKEGFLKPPPDHVDTFVKAFDGPVNRRFFHLASREAHDNVIQKYLDLIFLGQMTVEDGLKKANDEANALVKWTSKPTIHD